MSFDVSALFTSIPVPTALDVINHLFTEHIEVPETRGKYKCSFEENTVGLNKDEAMGLLKLVLENCVFSFQGKFYKQLHGTAMGSPCSPVVANIYMEYFEELALGPEVPVPSRNGKGMWMTFSVSFRKVKETICLTLRPLRTSIQVPPAAYVSCWGVACAATHLSAVTQSCLLCRVASLESCPTFIPLDMIKYRVVRVLLFCVLESR